MGSPSGSSTAAIPTSIVFSGTVIVAPGVGVSIIATSLATSPFKFAVMLTGPPFSGAVVLTGTPLSI